MCGNNTHDRAGSGQGMQVLKLNTRHQSWLADEDSSDDEDPFAGVSYLRLFVSSPDSRILIDR